MPRVATNPRKRPVQARAQDTVESILDATAQLLGAPAGARVTTNAIAARAGVSIGTLYEYFPNREAILVALFERVLDEQMRRFLEVLAEIEGADLERKVRGVIEALIAFKRARPGLSRALAVQTPPVPRARLLRACGARLEEHVIAALTGRPDLGRHPDLQLTAFVANNAVIGVIDAVLADRPELIADDRLTEALCDLVLRYLRG